MHHELDQYYLHKPEPLKSTLLALRELILRFDDRLEEAWKYRMPFFCYKGKMFCYLWVDKKTNAPYIGIVEGRKIDHPKLQGGDRARMKILPIDMRKDLPVRTIHTVLKQALTFYN